MVGKLFFVSGYLNVSANGMRAFQVSLRFIEHTFGI